jgi:hypothetical protein
MCSQLEMYSLSSKIYVVFSFFLKTKIIDFAILDA